MSDLTQSTAVTIRVGPFLDAADGVTEETGLTPGIELSKNNGAFASRNDATAPAHDAEAWYSVVLDATDTNTLGRLIVKAQDAANHLPVWHEFTVVPAQVSQPPVTHSFAGFVKTSTASKLTVGPFISVSTGLPLTSFTPGDITCGWMKPGDADNPPANTVITLTASGGSNDIVHLANGYFYMGITTANTNTAGTNIVTFQDPDVFRPFDVTCIVVPSHVFGAVDGTDTLNVDVVQWLGTAVTADTAGVPNVNTTYISNDGPAADQLEDAMTGSTNVIRANVVQITADATAATNAKNLFDGSTGYAGGSGTKLAVDMVSISGDTTAADNLEDLYNEGTPVYTVTTGTSAIIFTSAGCTEATVDHYVNKQVQFTTGVLAGQRKECTAYRFTAGAGEFTCDTFTEAPGAGDKFYLV